VTHLPNVSSIDYTPSPGFTGLDSFDITFVDAAAQTVTGTVLVHVVAPGSATTISPTLQLQPNGQAHMVFRMTGGLNFTVQTSTDLLNWTNIGTLPIMPHGQLPFIDPAPSGDRRFYRAIQAP
jgi:hypothetical protein